MILGLFQHFCHAGPTVKLHLGCFIEIGTKLSKGGEFPILGQRESQRSRNGFHGLCLSSPTNTRNGKTGVNGRPHTGIEKIRFQINLPIRNGNDVRWNIPAHVASLGLDDRKSRHAPSAMGFISAASTFKQSGMEIKHIARISFPSRRTAQEQAHGAVSHRVLA